MCKNETTAVDQFAELLGVQVLHRSLTKRVASNVKDEHMNALGGVHGGVIFSLADIALRWLVMQGMRHTGGGYSLYERS